MGVIRKSDPKLGIFASSEESLGYALILRNVLQEWFRIDGYV
jgi:hypothetical protein